MYRQPKASDYTHELYDSLSCLAPIELLHAAQDARISLVAAMALRVCNDQTNAAFALNDLQAADNYAAVYAIIEKIHLYPET